MTMRPAAALLGILVLAALGAAVFYGFPRAYRRPGMVHEAVVRLLGPPARQLREAYAAGSGGPGVDHSAWDALLTEHVDADGWIDYAGMRRDRGQLEAYLGTLERAPYAELGRDEKLALLVNAYNAFTVRLITEHLPLGSIRDIPSRRRWKARRWQLAGRAWSLNELEHDEIRAHFEEPRIHFALVCGAAGCPPLAREAYVGHRLGEQLERQARYVHKHGAWLDFDPAANRLRLTELFSWYRGDFEQAAGSIVAYASRYRPELGQALEAGRKPDVRWILYDWKLNSVDHRKRR